MGDIKPNRSAGAGTWTKRMCAWVRYRAVDDEGQVVDVLLYKKRDLENAKAFFGQAIKRRGVVPDEVVTDKHRAYPRAIR